MPDELSGVSPIAVDRSNRDFPRRDPQQQNSRRQPPKRQQPQAAPLTAASGDEPPVVGSRLNVQA